MLSIYIYNNYICKKTNAILETIAGTLGLSPSGSNRHFGNLKQTCGLIKMKL